MHKTTFLLALLIFFTPKFVEGQVKISTEYDKQGNVVIVTDNSDIIPYSVILNVSLAENLDANGSTGTIYTSYPGKNNLVKFNKVDQSRPGRIRYSYKFIKGKFNPKYNIELPYLLPVSEGEAVKIVKIMRVGGASTSNPFTGFTLYLENPTVICAPRKGTIASIKEEELEEKNTIDIYHDDGTFTTIMIFKSGTVKVKSGDQVFPGMPLAESVDESFRLEPQLRIYRKITSVENGAFKQSFIEVPFVSGEDSYITPNNGDKMVSIHPDRWIKEEMSKRDVKRYESEK